MAFLIAFHILIVMTTTKWVFEVGGSINYFPFLNKKKVCERREDEISDVIYHLSYLQSYITKALVAMLTEEVESLLVISTNDLLCILFSYSKTWHASLSVRHGWLRVLMRSPLCRASASKAMFYYCITINGNKIVAFVCMCGWKLKIWPLQEN